MGALASLASRAIIGRFYEVLEEGAAQWAQSVGMMVDSNQESETYKWLGMSPALREWVAGRNAVGLRENGITIDNKLFEATLNVNVDDKRRDKTGQIDIRISELADRVNQHWNKLLSDLIINAESTACYDGQFFYDTDHSEGDSGSQSNDITSDVGTASAPTADEYATAIIESIGQIYGFKDDQGEPMNTEAQSFLVMTPPTHFGSAQQAISSNQLDTGSGTRDNPLRSFNITHVTNPRLTSTTKFQTFRIDGRAKPFILQEEIPIEISALAEGSEEEFKNNTHLYGVKAIRNVGYGLWQHSVLTTFI